MLITYVSCLHDSKYLKIRIAGDQRSPQQLLSRLEIKLNYCQHNQFTQMFLDVKLCNIN